MWPARAPSETTQSASNVSVTGNPFMARCCLTSRAQARGADDSLRDSGTGDAIPRCLQRFVRRGAHHVKEYLTPNLFLKPRKAARPRMNNTLVEGSGTSSVEYEIEYVTVPGGYW